MLLIQMAKFPKSLNVLYASTWFLSRWCVESVVMLCIVRCVLSTRMILGVRVVRFWTRNQFSRLYKIFLIKLRFSVSSLIAREKARVFFILSLSVSIYINAWKKRCCVRLTAEWLSFLFPEKTDWITTLPV